MQIHLRFFASLREAVGTSQETLELPADVKTANQVREHLRARGGVWAEALADGRALRMAYNQQMAAYQAQHGVLLLTHLDVHAYPQAKGVTGSAEDEPTGALRLRSTGMWADVSYVEILAIERGTRSAREFQESRMSVGMLFAPNGIWRKRMQIHDLRWVKSKGIHLLGLFVQRQIRGVRIRLCERQLHLRR